MNSPIVPPATIGMLGGGQLGKYALVAANAIGYRTVVVDPGADAPAAVVANEHVVAAYDDPAALDHLASTCDVVTTEFENAPAGALESLALRTLVAPGPAALAVAQNRIVEKTFMVDHGIDVGPFVAIPASGAHDDVLAAARSLAEAGAVVKTARFGYDGKGQARVATGDELDAALLDFAGFGSDTDVIVEALLDLRAEVSVLVARDQSGGTCTWPVAENVHVDGILDVSVVPARIDDALATDALAIALSVAEALDYVGVLAVELFVVADDDGSDLLLLNEIAPRPHNSGHWTLDACVTSQFEQQVRSVCGVGFGSTDMTAPGVAMVNLLGDLWFPDASSGSAVEPDWAVVLADPHASLHLYGKSEARAGRKMGHLTVTADTPGEAHDRALALRAAL